MSLLAPLCFRGAALPGIGGLLHKAVQELAVREYCTTAKQRTWSTASRGLGPEASEGDCDTEHVELWEDDAHLTDLTEPASWYPIARKHRRRIIAHIGPTNSGKTHHALEALKGAESGVYCGPLRLLAWEVAEKLNAAGVPSNLVTGQEVKLVPQARHVSSTVEMADVNHPAEVGVVDEVQLVQDPSRGASFTRAVLGLPVRVLHVCGDPSVLHLLEQLASDSGDALEVLRYERLAPLVTARRALPKLASAQRGDCLVAFSRRDVHGIKREVECAGRHSCCVVYGALPPTSRAQQAELFNTARSGYNVLAASDAVGMGLNLNIRRVVFTTLEKFDGYQQRRLLPSEVKQIAGRAGRFGSKYGVGVVTCLDPADLRYLRAAMEAPVPKARQARLLPRYEQLALFQRRSQHSHTLAAALDAFADRATLARHYCLGDFDNMRALAASLEHLPLSLREHYLFAMSPTDAGDAGLLSALLCFATGYSIRGVVGGKMCGPLPHEPPRTEVALQQLEALHREFDLYLWLSFRMPAAFPDQELVKAWRLRCSDLIRDGLDNLGPRARRTAKRRGRTMAPPGGSSVAANAARVSAAIGGVRHYGSYAGIRHFPKHLLRRPGEKPKSALPPRAAEPLTDEDDNFDPKAPLVVRQRPDESRSEKRVRKREEGVSKQVERDFGKGILPPFSDEEEEDPVLVPQYGPGMRPKQRKKSAKRKSSKSAPFPLS